MDTPTRIGLFIAVLAFAVSLFFGFAPYEWRDLPRIIRRAGLLASAVLAVGAFVLLFFAPGVEYPEVTLSFVGPKDPDIQIHNPSNVVAENIKWALAVWDVDNPSRHDPLPFPADTFDFLTPKGSSLPIALFSRPQIAPLVKSGDVIFGSATVSCPHCLRGRTFWIYIKLGSEGWYSEVKSVTNGGFVDLSPTPYLEDSVREFIKTIPDHDRNPIQEVKRERLTN